MSDLTRRKKELLNSYNNLCSCYGDIISEQTKTINQLKELLRECVEVLNDAQRNYGYDDSIIDICSPIITKIDNAIGEK